MRATPPIYGKLQGRYPARWLTHEEAFGTLLGVCDDSDVGRRDEPIFRLGLAGMRVSEIQHITVGGLVVGSEPVLQWIGKKSRPRRVAVGPALLSLMTDYLGRYETVLSRELTMADPLVCRQKTGFGVGQISWGRPFKTPASIAKIVRIALRRPVSAT